MSTTCKCNAKGRKKYKSSFLEKLYLILETDDFQNEISWSEDRKSVTIRQPEQFAATVLPRYFKHNNLESFYKQMNMYNFKRFKNPENDLMFSHPMFQKGSQALVQKIERRHVVAKDKAKEPECEPKAQSTETPDTSEPNDSIDSDQRKKVKKAPIESELPLEQLEPKCEILQEFPVLKPKIENSPFLDLSMVNNTCYYSNALLNPHNIIPRLHIPRVLENRNQLFFNQVNFIPNQIHFSSLFPGVTPFVRSHVLTEATQVQMNFRLAQMGFPQSRNFF